MKSQVGFTNHCVFPVRQITSFTIMMITDLLKGQFTQKKHLLDEPDFSFLFTLWLVIKDILRFSLIFV